MTDREYNAMRYRCRVARRRRHKTEALAQRVRLVCLAIVGAVLFLAAVGFSGAETAPELDAPATCEAEPATAEPVAVEPARLWDVPLTDEELAVLLDACDAGGIAPELALGLIQVESGFQADAVSTEGCYGYCQLNPRYFPADLSPADNIRAGIEYLEQQLVRYGSVEAALTAYNAGHDTGSRTYANAVLAAAARFERG